VKHTRSGRKQVEGFSSSFSFVSIKGQTGKGA
jgi:hypothetical protein